MISSSIIFLIIVIAVIGVALFDVSEVSAIKEKPIVNSFDVDYDSVRDVFVIDYDLTVSDGNVCATRTGVNVIDDDGTITTEGNYFPRVETFVDGKLIPHSYLSNPKHQIEEIDCAGIIELPLSKFPTDQYFFSFVRFLSSDPDLFEGELNGEVSFSIEYSPTGVFDVLAISEGECRDVSMNVVADFVISDVIVKKFTTTPCTELIVPNSLPNNYLRNDVDQGTIPKKNGGSSSPPPPSTFGKNKNLDQIVTDGFCFNDNCVDVTDYHTEFPLIVAPVGETSNITVKVYNPHGLNEIKAIQVVLGMPGAGEPINRGEVINTFYLYQSEIDEIVIRDKNNLIGESTVSTSIVGCSDQFSSKCLELSFDFIPRDQLINNVVAINTFNIHRAGTTNYINDGVEFQGKSLNEPLITHVSASKGGAFYPENRGSIELQLVSYREDLWQDKYGYLWTGDNHKSFVIISDIPVPIKKPDLMWSVMNRDNSNFSAMIIHEAERAVLVFDASKLISTPTDPWTYDAPRTDEEVQAELDIRIALEADRAEKELQAYFDYIYAGKVQD